MKAIIIKSINKSPKNETVFYARYDCSPKYPFISVIFKTHKFIFSINLNKKKLIREWPLKMTLKTLR